MTIRNDNDLIGDFIGTIPAMQALPALYIVKPHMAELAEMAGIRYTVTSLPCLKAIDLQRAFRYAAANNLHMIQANFQEVGLPVPDNIPRPKLIVHEEEVPEIDYVLSPFSRSLPEDQKWPREKWQQLIDTMYYKTFALIGGPNDDKYYLTGCLKIFGKSLNYIANLLLHSKGLISVTTGTSRAPGAAIRKLYS
jgi:hypothetical protein